MSDVAPAPNGPCSSWAEIAELPEGCPCVSETSGDEGTPSEATLLELLAEATDILWAILGRPNIGICEAIIHPETRGICGYPITRRHGLRTTGQGYLGSAVLLDRVPVNDVLEVIIDGEVVDPTTYELHDGQWLVRDPGSWPPGGGPATDLAFRITYTYGIEVPPLVRDATIEIANYLWSRHCGNTGGNTIPEAVDSLGTQGMQYRFRRGNTENAAAVQQALPSLTAVGLARSSYNPTGQNQQTYIYSPDLAYTNRVIRSFA